MDVFEQRFWAKVERGEGCWQWTGARDHGGYGSFWSSSRRTEGAHRFAYRTLVGPIPTGLELDHLCRNRACVNPAHLEPVTRAQHARRSVKVTRLLCPNGHPRNERNVLHSTEVGRARTHCRVCTRDSQRRRQARLRAAG